MTQRAGNAAAVPGQKRTRVAFIAGASWSGSTLLEQELAQIDDCLSVGETFWIWDRNWELMTCECGLEFRECEFWSAVLAEAYGTEREAVRSEVRARSQGLWRHSVLPALARSRTRLNPSSALDEIGALVEPLYRAVETVSGASHIVDATKAGLWGLTLSRVPSIDLRVVHLVRDPLAYLDSDGRSREVPYPPGATRPPRPPARSLVTWLLLHLEADVLARRDRESITVLYDDLVRAPDETAERVARAIGLDADLDGIFEDGALVVDRPGHAIGGNPRRPRAGQTPIKRDLRPGLNGEPPFYVRKTLLPIADARYRKYASSALRQSSRKSAPPAASRS